MDMTEYVITRRFSEDGQIIDYLLDWDTEHSITCTMMLARAMRIGHGPGSTLDDARKSVRLARLLCPTWFQTDAERAAGLPAKPICWGIARVEGEQVIPVLECDDEAEEAAA